MPTNVSLGNALQYDLDSLRKGIEKCDNNIKIFEEAIAKEEETKRNFRKMIAVLEEEHARGVR